MEKLNEEDGGHTSVQLEREREREACGLWLWLSKSPVYVTGEERELVIQLRESPKSSTLITS